MNIKRISIRFCGGCNPSIDRGRIAAEIIDSLSGDGYEVIYNSPDADFIIYISGCTANCARRYNGGRLPCTVIAAQTVDASVVDGGLLGAETIKRVRDYFRRLEKGCR